jgi:CHAT domain
VLFLETHLDPAPSSTRSEIRFIREFLENFGNVQLVVERVHSRADLEKFLEQARHRPKPRVVHIVSHGSRFHEHPRLFLSHDESVDLGTKKDLRLFEDLGVEVLFLSCCLLGGDRRMMHELLETSGVLAVVSYATAVSDYQAFITESLFYHLAYGTYKGKPSDLSFREIYERLRFALDYLGIDDHKRPLVDPMLEAAFADES